MLDPDPQHWRKHGRKMTGISSYIEFVEREIVCYYDKRWRRVVKKDLV
jgi:hypothetical protein